MQRAGGCTLRICIWKGGDPGSSTGKTVDFRVDRASERSRLTCMIRPANLYVWYYFPQPMLAEERVYAI
jgi:hypothetical protein